MNYNLSFRSHPSDYPFKYIQTNNCIARAILIRRNIRALVPLVVQFVKIPVVVGAGGFVGCSVTVALVVGSIVAVEPGFRPVDVVGTVGPLVLTGVTGPVEADALEGPPVVVDSLVLPVEVGVLVEVDEDVDETVELEGETT